MKTKSPSSNPKLLAGAAIGFVLLLLACYPQSAIAQTNTFPSSGNVGIGTTTPGRPLVVTADSSGIPLRVYRNANDVGWGTGINWAFNNSASSVTDYAYVNSTIVSNTAGSENGTLGFWTVKSGTLTQQAIIDQNGNLGIGTATPNQKLGVQGMFGLYPQAHVPPTARGLFMFHGGTGGAIYAYNSPSGTGDPIEISASNIDLRTFVSGNQTTRLFIANGGNVGIGTTTPSALLDVNGNTNVTGNINVTGYINAKYQDIAEWVPASRALPAGTVVTLDPNKSNHVEASSKAYDTRVAGVISARPGIALGEGGENRVLVATTGRVRLKVDASDGPIQVGDLLVTSDIPGVAMKSQPVDLGGIKLHRPGTLIGKALEPLKKGTGEILVLLSLQ